MAYLSKKEAAARLRCCLNTLMKLDVPRFNVGRKVLFDSDDLDRWVKAQKYKAPTLTMPAIEPRLEPRRTKANATRWRLEP